MTRDLLLVGMSAALVAVAILAAVPSLRSAGASRSRLAALGDPLASGIFLGAGLVHMLPDAAHGYAALGIAYPWPFVVCGGVALALTFIERIGSGARGPASLPLFATAALGVHSLLAGAALGATIGQAALLVLFVALIAHKGAASFSLSRLLAGSLLPRTLAIAAQSGFIVALPLGVVLGAAATHRAREWPIAVPTILAMGAGTFLFFGAMHRGRIGDGHRSTGSLIAMAGFAIMAIVATVA